MKARFQICLIGLFVFTVESMDTKFNLHILSLDNVCTFDLGCETFLQIVLGYWSSLLGQVRCILLPRCIDTDVEAS
jgi:hypothetical protein